MDPLKRVIEEILLEEDPNNPYSDQQVSDLLKEKGYSFTTDMVNRFRRSRRVVSLRHNGKLDRIWLEP